MSHFDIILLRRAAGGCTKYIKKDTAGHWRTSDDVHRSHRAGIKIHIIPKEET